MGGANHVQQLNKRGCYFVDDVAWMMCGGEGGCSTKGGQ